MADYQKALLKILRHEGVEFDAQGNVVKSGYVNHPDDPGGETIYGITEKTARRYGYSGPMRDMPLDLAKTIYRAEYWDKLQGDNIPDQDIAEELFDTAVNCGVETVVYFMQRALNVLNKKGTAYPDIEVDGKCGPKTLGALSAALRVQPWYRLCILRALDSLQCVRYIELAEKHPRFESFLPGWLRTRVGVA